MADKTTFFRDAVLNTLRGMNITAPATIYVALHTADPGVAGDANEVTGGSYARQAATFSAPADNGGGRAVVNDATVEFPGMPALTVTHLSLKSALSGGDNLYRDEVPVPQAVNANGVVRLPAGSIVVRER
jgi:hypothetical protein